MSMSDDMVKYYSDRAKEYEEIYAWRDPGRQEEQDLMGEELKKAFNGKRVLDIGCGTGYWSKIYSETAESVLGIDINETVLDIARSKEYGCPAEFKVMDAYNMDLDAKYTGTIASFMLSHVLVKDMAGWIDHVHDQIEPGASVFIADNTFVEGIGGKLHTEEGDPNTYKLRTLNDGSQHMIVKNYFTVDGLVELFGVHTDGFTEKNVFMGTRFWWVNYQYRP